MSDPLADFLGFDPSLEPGEVREIERVVQVERAAPPTSLEYAIETDPRAVMIAACKAVFERAERDLAAGRIVHPGGALSICREATFAVLKETAHAFRSRIGPGWIIGKRDNPQQ